MAWDEDRKALAISKYQEAEPTAENSMEIVKEIAEEMGESANGVRQILTKAEVYIKKTPAAKSTSTGTTGAKTGGTRVSKEASQTALREAIEAAGQTVDEEIISKLTGKAAVYFTTVLTGAAEKE